jgi:V/A-type H+-transporting ATPase subunit K
MEYILLFVLLAMAISPIIAIGVKMITGKKAKYALFLNIASFAAICILTVIGPLQGIVLANEAVTGAATVANAAAGMGYLAAGIAVGAGCLGAGIAVAASSSTAIGALSENPDVMGKAIIFVALGEGIALYGIIIAVLILNRL